MFGVMVISRSFVIHNTKPKSSIMKVIIFALALVAIVAAAPVENEPIQIVRSVSNQQPDGSYSFSFETQDGTVRDESGVVKEAYDEDNKPHNVVVVKGTYTYTNTDGQLETISYTADETGYHPVGDSIPKPVEPVSRR